MRTASVNYTESYCMQSGNPVFSPGQLVAHRGYRRHFPENTLRAIREAIAVGARHVEFDIQLSADAVPMVYHDATLRRISARAGTVMTETAEVLLSCPAHEPRRFKQQFIDEKIASLAALVQLMQQHPAVHFYAELKDESVQYHGTTLCLAGIAAVLEPVMSQCTLISFDIDALAQARAHGFQRIGPVLRDWISRNRIIDELRADTIFIDKHAIPANGTIAANCPVVIYEVDDRAEAQRLLQRGVDKIETFAIGELLGKR